MKIDIAFIIISLLLSTIYIQQTTADINRGRMTLLQAGIEQVGEFKKKRISKKIAKHMYKRILYWQRVHKIWQEQERKEYDNKERIKN